MDLITAHSGMNFNEEEFIHVLNDILAALDKNNVEAGARNELII